MWCDQLTTSSGKVASESSGRRTKRHDVLERLFKICGGACVLCFSTMMCIGFYLAAMRPHAPDAAHGLTRAFSFVGGLVYVAPWESNLVDALLFLSVVLAMFATEFVCARRAPAIDRARAGKMPALWLASPTNGRPSGVIC